ncbi:hypothetical protein LJC08_03525 [Methanimicrococcus sp. OttesenSCG-928-J09]|nr:hypothetical protein [Methanimicrococcus sp. OttesenSCG-928-J09]
MNNDLYKIFTLGGWILLILSAVQIFLLPIFIVPLPILFIPTAIVFVIAAFVKKMETAFPSYLNNEKESIIYNLKIVSWAMYITAALPLVLGIYKYMTMTTDPSFLSSLINLIGIGATVISSIILFLAGYLIRILNYGTKNVHTYTVGYNVYRENGNGSEYTGEYNGGYDSENDYNNEADYTDAEFTENK